jgi:hypothetical protein
MPAPATTKPNPARPLNLSPDNIERVRATVLPRNTQTLNPPYNHDESTTSTKTLENAKVPNVPLHKLDKFEAATLLQPAAAAPNKRGIHQSQRKRVPPDQGDCRKSSRTKVPRDMLKPTHHGKVYTVERLRRKQRVPICLEYPGKQRVSPSDIKRRRVQRAMENPHSLNPPSVESPYSQLYKRFRKNLRKMKNERIGWSDMFKDMSIKDVQRLFVLMREQRKATHRLDALGTFDTPMPKPDLPPIFPNRLLNLNEDGTSITYRKLHEGPYAEYWQQADAEEIERLFTSGTLRPIYQHDIPPDRSATYVNPVCSEKLRDSGAIKFRTRATIGGDQIDYPYNTTAVTANLECIKILLNAMISDDVQFSTIVLEDFYLGTNLPRPEYIRIPTRFIPPKVIAHYKLQKYIKKNALYCAVLKTHYGLPQAGALSQERLFAHLAKHGYIQLAHSQSLFRNRDGSIRFSLVVDDFAVVWRDKASTMYFIQTLRKLYTVKVDWQESKYLGMDIAINRPKRHVTLSVPGYIQKLLRKMRPRGVKTSATPSVYQAPKYNSPRAQTATVDESPMASQAQQHELQVIVGTLLYYARTVDPSILTAVCELGSVQASPTQKDMLKAERLLQYVSTHQRGATRYYASDMQLQVQSDASYPCRTKARSVLGGFHFLGTPERINGPIFCTSKIISCVCASVAEAELGAAFQNAQKAAEFRNTLHELGYPQIPTTIRIDNTVAEGLAADTINAKRSKSMDVRFFWLRDRIKNGQFAVKHLAGKWNISDFFTKSLPRDKFDQFSEYVVTNLDAEPPLVERRTKTITLVKTPL